MDCNTTQAGQCVPDFEDMTPADALELAEQLGRNLGDYMPAGAPALDTEGTGYHGDEEDAGQACQVAAQKMWDQYHSSTLKAYTQACGVEFGAADTSENQRILAKLVQREVVLCVSSWVEAELARGEGEWWECYEEATQGTESYTFELADGTYWEGSAEERDEAVEKWTEELETAEGDRAEELEAQIYDAGEADPEPAEVLEWWVVSKWIGGKLAAMGEVVMESPHGNWIWGRTCSGQGIASDCVWAEIAADMQILTGQANEWTS